MRLPCLWTQYIEYLNINTCKFNTEKAKHYNSRRTDRMEKESQLKNMNFTVYKSLQLQAQLFTIHRMCASQNVECLVYLLCGRKQSGKTTLQYLLCGDEAEFVFNEETAVESLVPSTIFKDALVVAEAIDITSRFPNVRVVECEELGVQTTKTVKVLIDLPDSQEMEKSETYFWMKFVSSLFLHFLKIHLVLVVDQINTESITDFNDELQVLSTFLKIQCNKEHEKEEVALKLKRALTIAVTKLSIQGDHDQIESFKDLVEQYKQQYPYLGSIIEDVVQEQRILEVYHDQNKPKELWQKLQANSTEQTLFASFFNQSQQKIKENEQKFFSLEQNVFHLVFETETTLLKNSGATFDLTFQLIECWLSMKEDRGQIVKTIQSRLKSPKEGEQLMNSVFFQSGPSLLEWKTFVLDKKRQQKIIQILVEIKSANLKLGVQLLGKFISEMWMTNLASKQNSKHSELQVTLFKSLHILHSLFDLSLKIGSEQLQKKVLESLIASISRVNLMESIDQAVTKMSEKKPKRKTKKLQSKKVTLADLKKIFAHQVQTNEKIGMVSNLPPNYFKLYMLLDMFQIANQTTSSKTALHNSQSFQRMRDVCLEIGNILNIHSLPADSILFYLYVPDLNRVERELIRMIESPKELIQEGSKLDGKSPLRRRWLLHLKQLLQNYNMDRSVALMGVQLQVNDQDSLDFPTDPSIKIKNEEWMVSEWEKLVRCRLQSDTSGVPNIQELDFNKKSQFKSAEYLRGKELISTKRDKIRNSIWSRESEFKTMLVSGLNVNVEFQNRSSVYVLLRT